MGIPIQVLVVEDSEPDAELLLRELRRSGYEPEYEIVDTPEGMRNALDRHLWDIIIADYVLPHFSGLDALRMVQALGLDIPLIVVSGKIDENVAVDTMLTGAKDYILKNNMARLAPAIKREIVDSRRRQRAHEARKQAERALDRAYDEMEQRVVERTEELLEANKLLTKEIAERRRVEEALWQNQVLLQSIIDSSNAAIYVKDSNGRFIIANEASVDLLGITKEEAIGKTDHDLMPREAAELYCADDRQIIQAGIPCQFEEIIQKEDGFHTYVTAKFPIRDADGDVYAVGGISADITEQAKLRQELEHSLEREHDFSLLLQNALLPGISKIGEGYEVAAEYVPSVMSNNIGGDFYDVFMVGEHKAGVLIGDVSGKGLAAAAMAATTRSTVHAFVHETVSAAQVLGKANSVLCTGQSESYIFATVFLVIVDLISGRFSYSSAGHPPAAICRSDGRVEYLKIGQIPLAILDTQQFQEHQDHLNFGDKLVLYTDGISEARKNLDLFELEGIQRTLEERSDMHANDLARELLRNAINWADGKLADDAAVVVVERNTNDTHINI